METQNRITSMIEQRIREDVRPQADKMADAMHRWLEAELGLLGVSHFATSMHKFVREVRDLYFGKLVEERYSALVDKLLPDAMAEPEPSASVNAIEITADPMVMSPGMAELVRKMIAQEQAGLVDKLQRTGRI